MSEKQQYEVKLEHKPNPDVRNGGYWTAPVEPGTSRWVPIACVRDASDVCRTYIETNDLGAGNWTGGEVRQVSDDKVVAKVSYNGRIWMPSDKPPPHVPDEHPESPGVRRNKP